MSGAHRSTNTTAPHAPNGHHAVRSVVLAHLRPAPRRRPGLRPPGRPPRHRRPGHLRRLGDPRSQGTFARGRAHTAIALPSCFPASPSCIRHLQQLTTPGRDPLVAHLALGRAAQDGRGLHADRLQAARHAALSCQRRQGAPPAARARQRPTRRGVPHSGPARIRLVALGQGPLGRGRQGCRCHRRAAERELSSPGAQSLIADQPSGGTKLLKCVPQS